MQDNPIKAIVKGIYQIQKLRVMAGNRIYAYFRGKLGLKPSEKEAVADAECKDMLERLRLAYKRISDGIAEGDLVNPKKFKPYDLITKTAEMGLVKQYEQLISMEEDQFKVLEKVIREQPIYQHFLKHVKGVGPAMSGIMISEFDIYKAEYPSSLHMYAGLDVAEDGKGRSRRKEHLVDREYVDKEGEVKTKKSITFNPFLKTKLMGVLAGSFLRAGKKDNPYREIYDNYKHRLQHRPDLAEHTKGHIDMMAKRYMIKRFLIDLYNNWRKLESLPVAPTYEEAKLGITHKKAA